MKNLNTKLNEFDKKLMETFSLAEIALINPNIYFNPEHVIYYMDYHLRKYDKCFEFLLKNRHLLTIEHTPEKHRELAKKILSKINKNK